MQHIQNNELEISKIRLSSKDKRVNITMLKNAIKKRKHRLIIMYKDSQSCA